MKRRMLIRRLGLTVFAAVVASTVSPLALAASAAPGPGPAHGGAVYTETNSTAGNAVIVFHRAADGTLTLGPAVATGGLGVGGKLGSQGAIALSESGKWLLAVNAGSDSVSLFRVQRSGDLELADTAPSGGDRPISVTTAGNLVYVLDAGSDAISGLRLSHGSLSPIAGSAQPLSGTGVGAAQVSFAHEGRVLVVTEKTTSLIDTFRVGPGGRAEPVHTTPSSGSTPFGFAVKGGEVLVTEAPASATSAYAVSPNGTVRTVTASVADGQSAACWAIALHHGSSVYVANTGANDVSRYTLGHGGALTLRSGNAGTTGAAPADLAVSRDDGFLYVLNGSGGSISGFAVNRDGSLTPLGPTTGVPVGVQAGLAAI